MKSNCDKNWDRRLIRFAGMSCLCALVMCLSCGEQVVVGREAPLPPVGAAIRDGGADAREGDDQEEESEVEQGNVEQEGTDDLTPEDQRSDPEDFD